MVPVFSKNQFANLKSAQKAAMFIKKDLRKINEILNDAADEKQKLLAGRKAGEFDGNLKILCREKNVPKLHKLETLSLYQNALTNIEVT